jgi:localization factor PodJL
MDQRTVESLLRRLVERLDESERRYGEALDELHTRLDHLSQTTEAARETGAPEDAETFERLHTRVSDLARRLENESGTPLDDFERLGRVLSGGLRGDFGTLPETEPEPSPFAQSVASRRLRSRLSPDEGLSDYNYTPPPHFTDPVSDTGPAMAEVSVPPAIQDFGSDVAGLDKRLVEMAERLEQSIGAAMPTSAIKSLNARIADIGSQINRCLETTPDREALNHVERQISEMGQQLNRAEEQLGRIGGVEQHLLKLIERLDQKDAAETAIAVGVEQLQDIAAKAATEAAQIVADDSKKTTERLTAMHRDLTAMSTNSREAGDKLVSTLEAVHESLKQLVQQVEHSAALGAKPRAPFHQPETKTAAPFQHMALPAAAKPAQEAETPKPKLAQPAPQKTVGAPRLHKMRPAGKPIEPEEAEPRTKEPLRAPVGAGITDFNDAEPAGPFGRAKRGGLDDEGADLDEGPDVTRTPDDLVAAARRAAQAAAARAKQRGQGRRPSKVLPGSGAMVDQRSRHKRSLLIISAAFLLIISAILLLGRLTSKQAEVQPAPAVATETAPAEESAAPSEENTTSPAEAMTPEADVPTMPTIDPNQSDLIPLPAPGTVRGFPMTGSTGKPKGVTDIAKSSGTPTSEISPKPRVASLKPDTQLPAGVIFSFKDPATAEKLTTQPAKSAGN